MSDEEEKKEEKEEEAELTGPLADRSCTDVIFLALFIVFLSGMGVISWVAYDRGNVALLIRGYDSYGNICGELNDPIEGVKESGKDMTDKPNLLWLNPKDLATSKYVKAVCVEKCPDRDYRVAQEIPLEFCLPGATRGDDKLCPDTPLFRSKPILHRCTPTSALKKAGEAMSQANKVTSSLGEDSLKTFASEVERSWKEITYISLVGVGMSFVILILLRFLAAVFVYLVYALVFVGSIAGTVFLWLEWSDKKKEFENKEEQLDEGKPDRTKEEEDDVTAFFAYAIVATILTTVLLLVMIAMWSRVKLVIALFKEASSVVMAMPLIVLQPLFTLIIVALFVLYWLVTLLYIASCKSAVVVDTSDGEFVKYKDDEWNERAFWYHLFAFFWVTQFFVAAQLMIIAGAVAAWYFTRDKSKLGWFPILASVYRTCRYHLGTLAFGSLIIAIVQMIQAVLTYIEKKLGASKNIIATLVLKCMFCCLWCLENFLKFINRNAYIMTAIYGYHFCKAAKRGFTLLVSNALRLMALNTVGDFCLFLAKILVVIVVVVIGMQITEANEEIEIQAIPIALGALAAYIIAHVFLSVYEMIVDTIFLCFCEDSERNDGSDAKPYYMSENLKEFVDTSNEKLKEREEKKGEKQKLVEE